MIKKMLSAVLACFLLVVWPLSIHAEKPNVVVFLVDDLGYMDIGANNPNTFYKTPHIDALAKAGMLFTDGYAASPVCSPTRYSLLTGRYPTRVGATNFFPKKKGKDLAQRYIQPSTAFSRNALG